MCRHYQVGDLQGPSQFNIGSCLSTVSVVRVEISGTHLDGWWDGDDVEDFDHGPAGGWLVVELNPEAGYWETPQQRLELHGSGPFHCVLTLRTPAERNDWQFLLGGVGKLLLEHPYLIGFGDFTVPPEVTVTSIAVIVEGEPAPIAAPVRITSLLPDGTLTWSGTPTGGFTHVELAAQASGPWREAAVVPSSTTTCRVPIAPGSDAGFFRVRYSER